MSQPLARDLHWMINYQIDDAGWRFVPVKRLVRGLVPKEIYLGGCNFCWEITAPEEPLVQSAVREGTWISFANVKLIMNALGVEPPMPKTGSGKKGALEKVDFCTKLVEFLFPDESLETKKTMIAKLTWRQGAAKFKEKERSILEMVAQLDEENREAPEFVKVIKLAKTRLKEQERREVESTTRKLVEEEFKRSKLEEEERLAKAEQEALLAVAREKEQKEETPNPASSSAGHSRKPSTTPPSLKDFLTKDMMEAKISLNRNPSGYGYRAYYPSSLLWIKETF